MGNIIITITIKENSGKYYNKEALLSQLLKAI